MSLKDDFKKLKLSVVNTQTTNIDAKLDKAVSDITSYKSQSGRNGYIDLVKALISKSSNGFTIDPNKGGVFGQTASPAAFGQSTRLNRYKSYEGTISTINYCYRALDVLTDNIIAPDDITKSSLDISANQFLEDKTPTEAAVAHLKGAIKKLKLEENLHTIVRNTLLFGDFFCELADAKTALTGKSYLAESYTQDDIASGMVEVTSNVSEDNFSIVIDYKEFHGSETSTESSKKDEGKTTQDKIQEEFSRINLCFHEPGNVVKLQSELYPVCFGYLIFPKTAYMANLSFKDQAVNDICASIVKSLSKKIPQMREFNQKELKDIIKVLVSQSEDQNKMMNVRYVPPDKMKHFMRPSTKFYPYGESVFESCQFTAKCLVALETALAVNRLNRSTEKRKIGVEIGLPRDAKAMVEKLKEEFRKRKVSLDSFGTVDTIPSMISTFEDVYIPQKDGKAFVDISTFTEGNVDIRGKVDELKFMRDSVVSSIGVPSSFINIEENLSNKAALGEENILFARTIVSHQKYLTHQINDLIQMIYNIVNPEEGLTILDKVSVSLPTPKSLQFEREARYISELANLIETLERVGVPKSYVLKKYLTDIDWADMKNFEIDEKIEKNLGTAKPEDDMGGMGGGGMGGY